MVSIRRETPDDISTIHRINELAFEGKAEAELVDALRNSGEPLISMVAEEDGQVVGHILFSPVTIQSDTESVESAGLGPMAVLPGLQGQGIGSLLVHRGLTECKAVGYQAVIVLGHPWFYPRFGFKPSVQWGIRWEHEAPEEAFMALELVPGALEGLAGVVRYLPQFEGV